jgi:hypothetical protein
MKTQSIMLWTLVCALTAAPAAGAQGAPANPDAAKRASEILAESQKAAGGDAVMKVERIEITSSGEVFGAMGSMAVDVSAKVSFPDKVRVAMVVSQFGAVENGFDGKAGWLVTPQGAMDLPSDMNNEALRGIALTAGIGIYRELKAGTLKAEFQGPADFDDRKAQLVEWVSPSGKVKLYFDAVSTLLIGARFRALTMQGAVEEERRWSDFRAVDGVQFPHKWTTLRDGQPYSSQTVKEVKINPSLDAAIFAKP